jgi:hypothetical protein
MAGAKNPHRVQRKTVFGDGPSVLPKAPANAPFRRKFGLAILIKQANHQIVGMAVRNP